MDIVDLICLWRSGKAIIVLNHAKKKKKSEKQEAIIGIKTNNQNVIERSNFIFPHVFMKHDLIKF